MVIAHGGGASDDAIALRHAAEKAGMRYQSISNTHALTGAIGKDDSLLVMQPDLLPEAKQALELLRAEGDRLLVVSAGPGTAASLERIDLDRAWGGAMTMPGSWLERLGGVAGRCSAACSLAKDQLCKTGCRKRASQTPCWMTGAG